MRCPSCQAPVPSTAAFCPACGKALPRPEAPVPVDASITGGTTPVAAWWWLLLILLSAERAMAWTSFPIDESRWLAQGWERPFLWSWGLGLGVLTVPCLALRKRVGGWLSALSGGVLALRACVPMLSEGHGAEAQVYGAVVSLMVASATLTFAFLYEQSFWGRLEDREKADH